MFFTLGVRLIVTGRRAVDPVIEFVWFNSAPQREYVGALHQKVILIDGRRLAELMIERHRRSRGARLHHQKDRQRLLRRGVIIA